MRIKKGSSKVAFVGDKLTYKIPYFSPKALKAIPEDIYVCWKVGKWRGLIEYFMDERDYICFKQRILSGWLQNLREGRLSKLLGDLVVTTHFSLLGLLNIQGTAKSIDFDTATLREAIKSEIQDSIQDAHTFLVPHNYGWHNDRVKLLDYGAKDVREFIFKYRSNFQRTLDVLSQLQKKPKADKLQQSLPFLLLSRLFQQLSQMYSLQMKD